VCLFKKSLMDVSSLPGSDINGSTLVSSSPGTPDVSIVVSTSSSLMMINILALVYG